MTELLQGTPYPAAWTVREGRDAYLAENGFTLTAYDDAWTEAAVWRVKIKVPNTRRHRRAIMLHDLHHVATGFGTDLAGEGEVSAWELRSGLRSLGLYVGSLVLLGTLAGVVFAPKRTWKAWRWARRARSLFAGGRTYETLLDMTVGQLRQHLGVPASGLATGPRGLHSAAPARAVQT